MNWNISAWCIRNPVPTIVLFLILIVGGFTAFFSLGIDETPNIDVPLVSVTVSEPGAAPAELETQITRKIEDAVAGIGNIKHITSQVNTGVSATTIEFDLGTNTDRAVNDVREAVSRIRQQLPQGIYEPVIQRIDFVGGPIADYTVGSSKRSTVELSWLVDNQIANNLMLVHGVGQVQRYGGVDREIRINLDPVRLEALGVTADAVSAQVKQSNVNMPGGRGEIGRSEQSIRTLGSAVSVDRLRSMQIVLPGGRFARLEELGTVDDATSEQRQEALLNGKSVVGFEVIRSTGSNVVDVENGLDAKVAELEKILPPDVHIEKVYSGGKYVRQSYEASFESLIIGALLAVVVIFLFLRSWRASLISALAMPLSVIPAFAFMKYSGYTLNNMSLLGLALVIGILVDDAIVEIENIVRHISLGKKPYDAAIEAADEIGLAVIATTMTVIVVFVPVAFMGGIPGQFFKQFGLTVAAAVLFSLLVARMVTPLMAAFWMLPIGHDHQRDWLNNVYDKLLAWALTHRLHTVIASVLFFISSLFLFHMLPTSLVGQVDRGESELKIELPPGAELKETHDAVERAFAILLKRPEVESAFATVGTAASSFASNVEADVNKADIYITLKPRDKRRLSQQQFEAAVRPELKAIPGVRIQFTSSMGLSGMLKVLLKSHDGDALKKASDELCDQMRGLKGLSDVRSSMSSLRPEILVIPDYARAADRGVWVQSIARTALVATIGDMDSNLAKFDLPDRQINIRVQIDPRYRKDVDVIGNLKVMGQDGKLVPLRSVADVVFSSGAFQIDRYGRQREVFIEGNLDPALSLGQALAQVRALPAYKHLPASVTEEPAGDAEIQRDVFSGFGSAIGSAILFIYAVLVLLFEGFLQPLTIMMSLPLALGGALIALLVFGQSLGMYALIGIVMLMGLVTKNAILLVEYCLVAMKTGMPRRQAISLAGETRMRPILMTTTAMIAGMIPIAVGIGAGSEARAPMALAVIGGLITSTVLTLIVVPVVFTYIDDFQNWLIKRVKGKTAAFPQEKEDERELVSSYKGDS
jgi:hydrophobe/amphiphile efflux-1 (HAE1) family protein